MCDKVVFQDPLLLKYCQGQFKSHGMCDKAVYSYLLKLKFIPDWFVTSKMIEELN